jgi:phosphoribosylformylglycinamidine (FGAM) synthase-like amidotransferase family enzyme
METGIMPQPRVLILRAPGTNCDQETAFAFEQAGAKAELLHVNRLLEDPGLCGRFQIFCIPGGFAYGDDVAAGRILGNQIQYHLADRMAEFKAAGKLMLGICNGFQVLIKSGVLLEPDPEQGPPATLTYNDSGKYEDRWVRLDVQGTKSVFLGGIDSMYLPVAHAEGKFVARDAETLGQLEAAGQLVLRYVAQRPGTGATACSQAVHSASPKGHRFQGSSGTPVGAPEVPYPDNPNGSVANVAGICDTTGRVLGLMPHPERHIDPTQHPRWTRGEAGQVGDGLQVFVNAVAYFS